MLVAKDFVSTLPLARMEVIYYDYIACFAAICLFWDLINLTECDELSRLTTMHRLVVGEGGS